MHQQHVNKLTILDNCTGDGMEGPCFGSLDEVLAPGRDGGALAAAYERDIVAAMDQCACKPAAAERLHATLLCGLLRPPPAREYARSHVARLCCSADHCRGT